MMTQPTDQTSPNPGPENRKFQTKELLRFLLISVVFVLSITHFIITLCFAAEVETLLGIDYIKRIQRIGGLILPIRIMVFVLIQFISVFGLTYIFFFAWKWIQETVIDYTSVEDVLFFIAIHIFLALPLAWSSLFNTQHILVAGASPYTEIYQLMFPVGIFVCLGLSLACIRAIDKLLDCDMLEYFPVGISVGFYLVFTIMGLTAPGINGGAYIIVSVLVLFLVVFAVGSYFSNN